MKQQLRDWIRHYGIRLDCRTTVTGIERNPMGEGWILHTMHLTPSSVYEDREEAFDFVINAAGAGSSKLSNLILEAMASLQSPITLPRLWARRRGSFISLASTTGSLYCTLTPTSNANEKPSPSSTKIPVVSSVVIPSIGIGVGIIAALKSRKLLCGVAFGIGTIQLMRIYNVQPQIMTSLPEIAQVLKDKKADRFLEMKASYIIKIPSKPALRKTFPEIAILGVRGTKHGMVQVSPYDPPSGDNDPLHQYYHIHSMTMTGTLFPGGIIGDHGKANAFPNDLQAIIDLPEWQQDSDAMMTKLSLK